MANFKIYNTEKHLNIPIQRWYDSDEIYCELVHLFKECVNCWLEKDKQLLNDDCSEQAICGALMLNLYEKIKSTPFEKYHTDVEYNRNKGFETHRKPTRRRPVKTLHGVVGKIVCDLILHSRGINKEQDNLIAIEMKKASADNIKKENDRIRLRALTDTISEGRIVGSTSETLPKNVCRYILGIFIEIDKSELKIEYYRKGKLINSCNKPIPL